MRFRRYPRGQTHTHTHAHSLTYSSQYFTTILTCYNCRWCTALTAQSAPAGREASRAVDGWLELSWQTDRWHTIVERQGSHELQQHDVVAMGARRSSVLGHWYDLGDTDALHIGFRSTPIMHADDDRVVRRTRSESVPQQHNKPRFILFYAQPLTFKPSSRVSHGSVYNFITLGKIGCESQSQANVENW